MRAALDPQGADPGRPRRFGLDNPRLQAELRQSPRLLHWVARADDLCAAVAAVPELGRVHRMSRGDLEWDITIPDDGALLEGGLVPTLIAWGDTPHPTTRLPDVGCRLRRMWGLHPHPERVRARLGALGLELERSEGRDRDPVGATGFLGTRRAEAGKPLNFCTSAVRAMLPWASRVSPLASSSAGSRRKTLGGPGSEAQLVPNLAGILHDDGLGLPPGPDQAVAVFGEVEAPARQPRATGHKKASRPQAVKAVCARQKR